LRYDRITEIFKLGPALLFERHAADVRSIGEDIARNYFYYAVVA
jgi:hypothetical protein